MRRRAGVVWRRAPGFLALSQEGRDVTVVHGAGADLWDLLDTSHDVSAIARTLSERYNAPLDVVRVDVQGLVALLRDQGYVEDADAS